MAGEQPVRDSEQEGETIRGVLFKLALRIGVVVFVGVWVLALNRGLEPMLALIRASLALLAVTACGWLAEQFVRKQRLPEPEPEPVAEPQPAATPVMSDDEPDERAA